MEWPEGIMRGEEWKQEFGCEGKIKAGRVHFGSTRKRVERVCAGDSDPGEEELAAEKGDGCRSALGTGTEIGGTQSPGEELRALGIGGRREMCWGRASIPAQFYLYFPKEVRESGQRCGEVERRGV